MNFIRLGKNLILNKDKIISIGLYSNKWSKTNYALVEWDKTIVGGNFILFASEIHTSKFYEHKDPIVYADLIKIIEETNTNCTENPLVNILKTNDE